MRSAAAVIRRATSDRLPLVSRKTPIASCPGPRAEPGRVMSRTRGFGACRNSPPRPRSRARRARRAPHKGV